MRRLYVTVLAVLLSAAGLAAQDTPKDKAKERVEKGYLARYSIGWFRAADTNGDGALTLEEYKAIEASSKAPAVEARFRHADKNGDGLVTLSEAKAEKRWEISHHTIIEKEAYERLLERLKEENAELYAELVERFDADGDGALAGAEVVKLAGALAKPADLNHDGKVGPVERFRAWADANHDGKIEWAEVRRVRWADLNKDGLVGPFERRHAAKVKAKVDRNHDGKVDKTERAMAAKRRADRNRDGKVDWKERRAAQKRRVDRNHDGRIQPIERRRARRIRPRVRRPVR